MKHFKFLSLLTMAAIALFSFTACGDDDDDNNKNNGNGNGTDVEGTISSILVGTWETVSITTERGEIAVNSKDPNVWQYWNRFVISSDGSFNGYSVNYQGDKEVLGDIEHTMIGKLVYDEAAKKMIVNNFIEGYHNVIDYLNGKQVPTAIHESIVISITKDELVLNQTNQGNVTVKMKKVSSSVNIPDNYQNNDSINHQPNDSIDNPIIQKTVAEMLVGTWGTTRIEGWAVSQDSTKVDEWNNTPRKDDAETGKTSLKYEEYVFTKDGKFERWAFDKETRRFGKTEVVGNFYVNGDIVTVIVGDISFFITIVQLDETNLVFKREAFEEEFRVGSNKIPAYVTDIIYTVKLK